MTGNGNAEAVLHSLQAIFDRQKSAFSRCTPLSLDKRLEALSNLLQSVVNHHDELIQAVSADFGNRAVAETRVLEIFPLIDEIRFVKRHLRRWMKPRSVAPNWQFLPSRAKIVYQPLGVVGVVATWNFPALISQSAWNRMRALVDDAAGKGARIIQAGSLKETVTTSSGPFPPTLILGADDSMLVMQGEIFGPILPVVSYSSFDEALSYINARPRPLALYYFDNSKSRTRQVLEQTTSGGVCINDCVLHFAQHRLPFGGVGPSGMGAYHGHEGFKTFSKKKGVFLQSAVVGSITDRFLKPPYTPTTDRVIGLLTGRNSPRPVQRIQLPE